MKPVLFQGYGDLFDESGPVAGVWLAEEAGGGVPGGGERVLHPAPVGLPGKEEPEGLAECSGEVGYGGIGGDYQVESLDKGGGVGEVAVVFAGVDRLKWGGKLGYLRSGWAFLEGDPLDARLLEQGEEGLEVGGAFAVCGVVGVAYPAEADTGSGAGGVSRARQVEIGKFFRLAIGDGFQGSAEEGGEAHEGDVMGEVRGFCAPGDEAGREAGVKGLQVLQMRLEKAEEWGLNF